MSVGFQTQLANFFLFTTRSNDPLRKESLTGTLLSNNIAEHARDGMTSASESPISGIPAAGGRLPTRAAKCATQAERKQWLLRPAMVIRFQAR
jgi:hypothetical protein